MRLITDVSLAQKYRRCSGSLQLFCVCFDHTEWCMRSPIRGRRVFECRHPLMSMEWNGMDRCRKWMRWRTLLVQQLLDTASTCARRRPTVHDARTRHRPDWCMEVIGPHRPTPKKLRRRRAGCCTVEPFIDRNVPVLVTASSNPRCNCAAWEPPPTEAGLTHAVETTTAACII